MRQINQIECSENLYARLLEYAKHFSHATILNSNSYEDKYGKYELLAAFGAYQFIDSKEGFNKQKFESNWWFGHFQYDLKNQLEKLESKNPSRVNFGDLSFFEPKILFVQKKASTLVSIYCQTNCEDLWEKFKTIRPAKAKIQLPKLRSMISKDEYLAKFNHLKEFIQYGDVYEVNFCQEFYAEDEFINPYELFYALNSKSPVPFSSFYKRQDKFALSLTPERYLSRRGSKIISQPIKGTAKRGKTAEEDNVIKLALRNSLKEQTENVMIVDLVRNDLSRIAKKGTVNVEELFGVYTFPTVHQLISTVTAEIKTSCTNLNVIESTFPMGSMTGAPKIRAMQIIDNLEVSRRELYSGAIGYFDPENDFDFNVVIRTLMFDAAKKVLSLHVGGAITKMSKAEEEYQECLLKAKAIFDLDDDQ